MPQPRPESDYEQQENIGVCRNIPSRQDRHRRVTATQRRTYRHLSEEP